MAARVRKTNESTLRACLRWKEGLRLELVLELRLRRMGSGRSGFCNSALYTLRRIAEAEGNERYN